MSQQPQINRGAGHGVYRPVPEDDEHPRQTGKRRVVEACLASRLHWPKGTKERRDAFRDWHGVAMQLVQNASVSFRMMALVERFLHIETGSLWPTNETLALYGGGCSERTIKRDLAAYEALGILTSQLGWRRTYGGKMVRTRRLWLSLPREVAGSISLLETQSHGDTSGPDDWRADDPIHGDTSGPDHGDTSGPFTIEGTVEREAGRAA